VIQVAEPLFFHCEKKIRLEQLEESFSV